LLNMPVDTVVEAAVFMAVEVVVSTAAVFPTAVASTVADTTVALMAVGLKVCTAAARLGCTVRRHRHTVLPGLRRSTVSPDTVVRRRAEAQVTHLPAEVRVRAPRQPARPLPMGSGTP
jgi:hypothetical protein